jgi:hypothetical protein
MTKQCIHKKNDRFRSDQLGKYYNQQVFLTITLSKLTDHSQ